MDSVINAASPSLIDDRISFAQIELAGMMVVIESVHVMLALDRPPTLTRLPRSHAAIDGVFSHDGQVVPLVDLRKWLEPGVEPGSVMPYVMVLGHAGRIIGLAVDAIGGVLQIRQADIRQIYHDSAAERFFHHVATLADSDQLVSVLDPVCLMNEVEAWADTATANSAVRNGAANHADQEKTALQVLVRLGATTLGFPAHDVGEIIALPTITAFNSATELLIGLMRWRDLDVAAIDLNKLMGIKAQAGAAPPKLMLMLSDGLLCAGLPIDEVVAVQSFAAADVEAISNIDLDYLRFYVGSTTFDDATRATLNEAESETARVMLVNSKTVLESCPLNNLSMQTVSDRGSTEKTTLQDQAGTAACVVFGVDVLWAIEIHYLKEIVPLPDNFVAASEPGRRGIVGSCEWRGSLLPVLMINATAGINLAWKRLMVVRNQGQEVGLLINEVVELLPARQGIFSAFTTPEGNQISIITVDSLSDRRSYRLFNVASLAFFDRPAEHR